MPRPLSARKIVIEEIFSEFLEIIIDSPDGGLIKQADKIYGFPMQIALVWGKALENNEVEIKQK